VKTTKCVLALASLGLIALAARPANADTVTTYTINFTTTRGGPAPVSGSFTYDSTVQSFSNFLVTWNNTAFDLTASANAPNTTQNIGCGGAPTPQYGFIMMSQTASCLVGLQYGYVWSANVSNGLATSFGFSIGRSDGVADNISSTILFSTPNGQPDAFAEGGWTIQAPEPPSILLLAIGCVGLFGARRKLQPV